MSEQHALLGQWVLTESGEGEVDTVRIQHDGTVLVSVKGVCEGLPEDEAELFEPESK